MPIRFPAVEDVPLANPPLAEVLCQVRFPTILNISRGHPIEFQEAIRKRFPELEEENNLHVRVGSEGGVHAANAEVLGRTFHFRTSDGGTLASLSTDAFALSTTQYTIWDAFAKDLALVHESAMAVYGLPYARRIGLRYVNHLDVERTGSKSFEEMKELLRPELVAMLTTNAWDRAEEMVSQVLLKDDAGRLILRVAAGAGEGLTPVILLDFDYYEEGRIPLEDLVERCNRYHEVIYRAFRWSMRSETMKVFDPVAREG